MAASTVKKEELTSQQLIFLSALRQILPALRQQSDKRLAERIGYAKLQEICDDFFGFIDSSVDSALSHNEYFALSCQVLKCLSNYITTVMQIPATINTIPNHMALLEWSVDQSYPNYAKAKLLRFVINPCLSTSSGIK